jgi:hypothetical protein
MIREERSYSGAYRSYLQDVMFRLMSTEFNVPTQYTLYNVNAWLIITNGLQKYTIW